MKQTLTIASLAALLILIGATAFAQPADPIETIRQHYAAINRKVPTYRKVKKELSGGSAEGGQLVAYFHGPSVMKIAATYFGETGKAFEDFYYWDGKLIFVLRTEATYDKPLSGKVVKKVEERFYFDNDKLIRWIGGDGKQVAAGSPDYATNETDYLKSSRQLSDGARAKTQTIEVDQ